MKKKKTFKSSRHTQSHHRGTSVENHGFKQYEPIYNNIYDIFRILSLHDPEIWFAHQGGEPSADSAAWRVDVIKTGTVIYIII